MKYAIFIMLIAFCVLPAIAGEDCPPVGGWNFICGPMAVEDLVAVPGTHWIVGSGMSEGRTLGRLHLIDADKKTWDVFYPGAHPAIEHDQISYPACSGAPDPRNFGAHGIAIRNEGNKTSTLLALNNRVDTHRLLANQRTCGHPLATGLLIWNFCIMSSVGMILTILAQWVQ
jgi:hypothetical protein